MGIKFSLFDLYVEFFSISCDLPGIPVLLGEHAAAVFLHIESQLPGLGLPLAEAGAEVPVEEGHAVLRPHGLRRPADALVVLVGTDQQRGGEVREAVLPGRLLQAAGVALGAPMVDVLRHRPDEVPKAVVLPDH